MLDGGVRLLPAYSRFRQHYFIPDYNGYNWELRPGGDKAIYHEIKDIMLSMSTEDYIDLPELQMNNVWLTLDDDSQEDYAEFKKEAILEVTKDDTITAVNAAVLASRLLQFASGTAYTETGDTIVLHDAKIIALKEVLDSLQGANVIILYHYVSDKERILHEIKGVTTLDDSKDVVTQWNQGKVNKLLINPQSASTGLNLQEGGHTFIEFTPSFSLQDTIQVYGRLHRQGQRNNVVVHRLLCEDTMDERVIEALEGKSQGQQALIDAVKQECTP